MGRDWRVDTLRGYFLVAMTLGHFPNALAPYTEYSFGYASAPDGFVFLSGLVATWVYLPLSEKRGENAMVAKVFRRARQIYLTHFALFTLGILFALFSGVQSFRALHPLRAFALGSVLLYQGGFDKILPMYCVFLLFTPIVLKQFSKGRAWLVGVVSAGLWISSQFGLGDNTARIPWLDLGSFNLCAWQAYFVAGQYLAYRQIKFPTINILKSRTLLAGCVAVATVLFVDRHLLALTGMRPLLGFSGHPDHNPARFLDALCLGYILCWIPRAVDSKLMHMRTCQFLNSLGGHSLQVFAFSMLISRFEAHALGNLPAPVGLGLALLTIVSLIVPVRLHQLYRQRTVRIGTAQPLRFSQPSAA